MKSLPSLIIVRPDDVMNRRVTHFSQQIISSIMTMGEADVVGLGTAIFLACSGANISTDIANVYVHEISLDYVDIPILGKFEVILFTLKSTPLKKTLKSLAKEIDGELNLTVAPEGQLVVVSRRQSIEKMVTLCLWKMAKFDQIKIIAGGTAINNAAKIALTLSKGGISKKPTYIKLISLERLIRTRGEVEKPITGVQIYLGKGKKKEEFSKRHKTILESIKKSSSQISSF